MNEGADRSGTLHGVGQPHVEGKLRRLAHGSQQQQDGGGGDNPVTQLAGGHGVEGVGHAEAAHVDPQQQDAHQQTHVADAGHHKGFLGGLPGPGIFKPEPDEQVGTQAHQLPGDVEQQEVVGQRQRQHGGDEQRLPRKIPTETRVALHVFQ